MGIKLRAAIVTDMPIYELARIFGPIHSHEGVYVTRPLRSIDRLKSMVGTAQSRVERLGCKQFAVHIISSKIDPTTKKEHLIVEGPLKSRLDYGQTNGIKESEETPPNQIFYDRQGTKSPEIFKLGEEEPVLFPEEEESFKRWLGASSEKFTGADMRTILRYWNEWDPKKFLRQVQKYKGAGYYFADVQNWVSALEMLSQSPKYQAALGDYGKSDYRAKPGMPVLDVPLEDVATPVSGLPEIQQLSPQAIEFLLSLPGKLSPADIQRYIKVMLGFEVPIEKLQEFLGMVKLMRGMEHESSIAPTREFFIYRFAREEQPEFHLHCVEGTTQYAWRIPKLLHLVSEQQRTVPAIPIAANQDIDAARVWDGGIYEVAEMDQKATKFYLQGTRLANPLMLFKNTRGTWYIRRSSTEGGE